MYFENHHIPNVRKGWIEVICGSMFSGKTEELIRRIRRAVIGGLDVEIFKPQVDTRFAKKEVVSHNKNRISSTVVKSSKDILKHTQNKAVVGIDEAQFFDEYLISVCNQLANNGIRVIVAGLDMDFEGKPFGIMPKLMAVSEFVTKVHAICVDCGQLAHFSHRSSKEKGLVVLGEQDKYKPLCRKCYYSEKNV